MKLVVKRINGEYVSAEQHARVVAAVDAVLSTTAYTFTDAVLAWAEYMDSCQVMEDKQDFTEVDDEIAKEFGYEPTEADLKFLATPIEELVPYRPHHEERFALYEQLRATMNEAAGEQVYFYDEEGVYG